ncbi:ImmA/IrrE family metallo-endopeptidase [Blastococcus sp. KM273128]|uniref:ImmA/IrrE family metallo-endopeptidase n=1 Tax=Blastococcus sp. KM273128 TaxID=2570314 RepID=UPI001F1FB0D2|nr:ImmA/IrrE family metallo-endopeptidase [Blastococcus sp. KM273128]
MNAETCADRALEQLDPPIRSHFASNPLEVLREELQLTVRAVETLAQQRDDGGACDGLSFLQDGVILYAPTPYSRRENFTLAHELGHWLIEQSGVLYDWIADQSNPQRLLETVCDRVAQRLLLPDGVLKEVVGEGPIRARHVLELYDASEASAPACAIALASRLPTMGAVAIIDGSSNTVTHSSVKPDAELGWPTAYPWPGDVLPIGHPLRSLAQVHSRTMKTFWSTPWGDRAEYYVDAVIAGRARRAVAILSDVDLWGAESLHLEQAREFDKRPAAEIHCCGQDRVVRGYPCPECGHPFCPACGLCRCQKLALREQLCSGGCFMRFQSHLLVDGLCPECRS